MRLRVLSECIFGRAKARPYEIGAQCRDALLRVRRVWRLWAALIFLAACTPAPLPTPTVAPTRPPPTSPPPTATSFPTLLLTPTTQPTPVLVVDPDARTPLPGVPSVVTLSTDGSVVTLGQFALHGVRPALVAQNPADPNEFAVVNEAGLPFIVGDYAAQEVERTGMTMFTRFHYQITSAGENDKRVVQAEWSSGGQLALLIDGDKNLDDGVWLWNPDQRRGQQVLRECWHPAICENIVQDQLTAWEAMEFAWSPGGDSLLIRLNLTHEDRQGYVIAPMDDINPGALPPVLRYEYANWSLGGHDIIVSGRGLEREQIIGRIGRDGQPRAQLSVETLGYARAAHAADFGGLIYALAARERRGDSWLLIDQWGRELTEPFTGVERVEWSPDHSALLVESEARRWLVFLPRGASFDRLIPAGVRDITDQVSGAADIRWTVQPPG